MEKGYSYWVVAWFKRYYLLERSATRFEGLNEVFERQRAIHEKEKKLS